MRKLIFILLSVLILTACQSKNVAGETSTVADGSYRNITPDELNAMLKDKDFVFINVHIPFAGNISKTDQQASRLPTRSELFSSSALTGFRLYGPGRG